MRPKLGKQVMQCTKRTVLSCGPHEISNRKSLSYSSTCATKVLCILHEHALLIDLPKVSTLLAYYMSSNFREIAV